MTQEEKAKAYDKAVNKLRRFMKQGIDPLITRADVQDFFPDLKESEDERIRKALIRYHQSTINICGIKGEEILAWLEKQGKHKDYYTKQELIDMGFSFTLNGDIVTPDKMMEDMKKYLAWKEKKLEKQGEKPQGKTALEAWKDMRLEVYQQASGNRHEPNYSDDTTKMFSLNDIDEIIEKISEQKSDNKVEQKSIFDFNANNWHVSKVDGKIHNIYNVGVEPKFQNGQWIVWQDKCYKVNYNGCGYNLIDQNGLSTSLEYGTVVENAHLWTIQDAKDGDVLYSLDSKRPFIYKDRPQFSQARGYCCINKFGEFAVWYTSKCVICTDKYIPATKKQRELLFQKMKESGWEWDAGNKELKKIDSPVLSNSSNIGKNEPTKRSEEDEEYNGEDYGIDSLFHAQRILEKTLGKVDGYQTDDGILSHKCAISAIKKIKQKPIWKAVDEQNLNAVLSFIDDEYLRRWLKDTIHKKYDKPAEWSDEDEKIRKELIAFLKENHETGRADETWSLSGIERWIAWLEKQDKEKYALKSFKDEDVRKFMQYIEKEAKAYEFNLPNRGYDIYAFAKDILYWLEKQGQTFTQKDVDDAYLKGVSDTKHELEKQEENPQGKTALEAWKDMRLEVYQQASGNRHEPNCSDDSTKMFSLNDIDEIIEKISEQKSSDKIEPKKVSIWKHWKDGIAGNGDGEQIYLIKIGNEYSTSSCLVGECDYIELSELDKLMQEGNS